jgi:hypothetical protein
MDYTRWGAGMSNARLRLGPDLPGELCQFCAIFSWKFGQLRCSAYLTLMREFGYTAT